MEKINFVHLHNHSENSINDSALKAKDMVKKAKNLGMKAIALTDHGNLMEWTNSFHVQTMTSISLQDAKYMWAQTLPILMGIMK